MRNRIVSGLIALLIRVIAWTSCITYVHRDVRERMEASGKGWIYAFWHGRQAFLVYLHRGDRIRTLVSKSRDGELIAQISRRFHLDSIRGSSSRGGGSALLEMKREIESGGYVGITPDGPKGPLHSVQPGILFLAKATGAPIVPVAYGARRAWVFGGWDRFIVPKPFNRIVMVYGEPVYLDPHAPPSQNAAQLHDALDAVTREADARAQGKSQW